VSRVSGKKAIKEKKAELESHQIKEEKHGTGGFFY